MTDVDFDTTEKVERTDVGFRLTVESKRGTGSYDYDKVKGELRTEEMPTADETAAVNREVRQQMEDLREFQPDEDGGDDE